MLLKQTARLWAIVAGTLFIIAIVVYWIVASGIIGSNAPAITNMSIATTTVATSTKPHNPIQTPSINTARRSSSVVYIAEHIAGASQFATMLSSTGVAAQLTGKGPYTIFVPTDNAFSRLPSMPLSKFNAAQKKRFIEYHVVVGRAVQIDAQVAGTIQAMSGDILNFNYGVDKIPMVNSAIFISEYAASNGVVYLIDNVLLPPYRTQL